MVSGLERELLNWIYIRRIRMLKKPDMLSWSSFSREKVCFNTGIRAEYTIRHANYCM